MTTARALTAQNLLSAVAILALAPGCIWGDASAYRTRGRSWQHTEESAIGTLRSLLEPLPGGSRDGKLFPLVIKPDYIAGTLIRTLPPGVGGGITTHEFRIYYSDIREVLAETRRKTLDISRKASCLIIENDGRENRFNCRTLQDAQSLADAIAWLTAHAQPAVHPQPPNRTPPSERDLPDTCRHCANMLRPDARFCPKCGEAR